MKDNLTEKQVQSIIKVLDEALADNAWEKSSFLKIIGKNLNEIREKLVNQVDNVESKQKEATLLANQTTKRQNMQEVYITLYSNEGSSIQSWERIIANLPKQMISRPIYASEEDTRCFIKSKENKYNEAYVAIYIDASDILSMSQDKILKDKFGKNLLSLKDKTLKIENISRFEHTSGTYIYSKGRLLLK